METASSGKFDTPPAPAVTTVSATSQPTPTSLLESPVDTTRLVETEDSGPANGTEPEKTTIAAAEEIPATPPAPLPKPRSLGEVLEERGPATSRESAFKTALGLWNTDAEIIPAMADIQDDESFFRLAAQHNGMLAQRIAGNFDLIEKLNLPVIVEMITPRSGSLGYLTIKQLTGDDVTLSVRDEPDISASLHEINNFWTGVAYIPWKNFLAYTGIIPVHAPVDSVITLKMLIKDLGFNQIAVDAHYDNNTRTIIRNIQEKHGLIPDGVVGPLTKIILYNENRTLDIPHIRSNQNG
jgi:general secretion pathway protein A